MSGRKIHKIKHYKKIKCDCGEVLNPDEYILDEDYEIEGKKDIFIYCCICGRRHKVKSYKNRR